MRGQDARTTGSRAGCPHHPTPKEVEHELSHFAPGRVSRMVSGTYERVFGEYDGDRADDGVGDGDGDGVGDGL